METKFVFGTYNVPSTSVNLTASYTVPGMTSKEVAKIVTEEGKSKFDDSLKGLLSVPKPNSEKA